MTFNNNWVYHPSDHDLKSRGQVDDLLASAAQGCGNLLLNVWPRGDGSVPEESVRVLESVGDWLKRCGGEAIYDSELFTFDLQERGEHRGDWAFHGPFTVRKNNLYWIIRRWPGGELTFGGLQAKVRNVQVLGEASRPVAFRQEGTRVILSGLPDMPPDSRCPVFRIECDRPPSLYQSGGLRIPKVPHPHYDPCPSDIKH